MSMRILHIGPSAVPVDSDLGGAVQRRALAIASTQAMRGHDVTIVSPADEPGERIHNGVTIRRVPLRGRRPVRDYEFLLRTRQLVGARRTFDVVHAHGSPDAARFLGRSGDVLCHTVDFFEYRATRHHLGKLYYNQSLNRFHVTMPVSDFCARGLRAYYPGLTSVITPVPNGVDLTQFQPDRTAGRMARDELGLPDGPLVVYLGRVCLQKGSDLLSDLADDLRATHPEATVVAVGPPEQFGMQGRSELMSRLAASGVVCTGAIPEALLRGVLAAAHVSVLPTRSHEMFGMAALEALACGTPVVASDLGGIPEAVGDGGLLFPPGDASALTAGVQRILDDMRLREQLSRAGLHHAQGFSWDRITDKVEMAYRSEGLNA